MKKAPKVTGEKTAGKIVWTPVNIIKFIVSVILVVLAVVFTTISIVKTEKTAGTYHLLSDSEEFVITDSEEDVEEAFEDGKTVDVNYMATNYPDCTTTVTYTQEEWESDVDSSNQRFTGYVYSNTAAGEETEDTIYLGFNHEATEKELVKAQKNLNATEQTTNYGWAMAIFFAAIAFVIMFFWHPYFSTYEQIWFLSIIVLASVFSIIFPEEDCNGINGLFIMLLYLLDTFLNILCELLISKQSKWNFIVSVFVELTEIAICLVLSYRFATLASTLFFWLPCDIISFVNWHRHPDKVEDDLTEVRTLKGWQEVLIIAGIVVWTVVVGWFLSGLDISTDLFNGNEILATIVCYMDACATAVGVCNGLFILFRFREQWIAWFIDALLEAAINILSGQYVLLVLKAGYLTNSTYGYIKWTKYIKSLEQNKGKKAVNPNAHEKVPGIKK